MNLSGIPPPLKSFSFHSYEFNKIKTFTNLRLEKYYQSYSFRVFFSFNSFSLISLLFSPKRILKKNHYFLIENFPFFVFQAFRFLVLNYKQIQETFTQPPFLLQISLCLSFQLWQLWLSLFLSFSKLQPTKSTERKVKPYLKFHWHRIQLLLRFNPRVNNSSIDPIPIKLFLAIH